MQAERFVHEYRTSLRLGDPVARAVVRERVSTGFLGALTRAGETVYAKGEQIEPMSTFAMSCLQYLRELRIQDPHILGISSIIALTARRLQEIAAQEITFDIRNEPALEQMVLRSGRLIIPTSAGVVMYAYRDLTEGDGREMALELMHGEWKTADAAVKGANGRNAVESTIIAHADADHDIGRTVLPLFALRYPDLGAYVPQPAPDRGGASRDVD